MQAHLKQIKSAKAFDHAAQCKFDKADRIPIYCLIANLRWQHLDLQFSMCKIKPQVYIPCQFISIK